MPLARFCVKQYCRQNSIRIAYFAAAAIARDRLESVAVAMIPYLVALAAILVPGGGRFPI